MDTSRSLIRHNHLFDIFSRLLSDHNQRTAAISIRHGPTCVGEQISSSREDPPKRRGDWFTNYVMLFFFISICKPAQNVTQMSGRGNRGLGPPAAESTEGFNPIGDAGRTLRALLIDGMGTWSVEDHQIALASPEQFEPDEVGLSLHLYHLRENAHFTNEFTAVSGATSPRESPLILELYYLLTAHPPNGETVDTSDTLEQHRMLSKAIQTFREHSVVTDPDLEGSLAGGVPLQITIDEDATDQVMDVWGSFQETPYLPSISYVVTPLLIETTIEDRPARVMETRMGYLTEETPPRSEDDE